MVLEMLKEVTAHLGNDMLTGAEALGGNLVDKKTVASGDWTVFTAEAQWLIATVGGVGA
jgi:hypothetical protein